MGGGKVGAGDTTVAIIRQICQLITLLGRATVTKILFALLLVSTLATSPLLTLAVSPNSCIAPCSLQVRLSIEPARDNEKVMLELEADDTDYYRLSELPLNERSPKTTYIRYPDVPAGVFTLTARLIKHEGRTWMAAEARKMVVVR